MSSGDKSAHTDGQLMQLPGAAHHASSEEQCLLKTEQSIYECLLPSFK